ncbi:unnamed protein product [Sympodiomycopsis kandeliae]
MSQEALTPFQDALAGALGATYACVTTSPLDVSKTRIQAGTIGPWERRKVNGKEVIARKNIGLFEGVLEILKGPEGIRGLYKGLGANVLNTFSMQFAYFYWYSFIRNFYITRASKRSGSSAPIAIGTAMELLIGALAGAVAQVFTIPVSVIATRQQLSGRSSDPTGGVSSSDAKPSGKTTITGTPASSEGHDEKTPLKQAASKVTSSITQDDSFLGVARDIMKTDGITGFWRGLKPSLVLTINPAITYGVFERVKTIILATSSDGKMTPWRSFLVGAVSKTLATIVTFPYILSKVRLQAKNTQYKSAFDVLTKIAKEKGIPGWYQGMQAQIMKAVLTQAILFVARDYFTGVVRLLLHQRPAARKV